uniref:Uncharacterized protein n=1 Tax=Cacopsylla melanoneura TaxID=428564 RepID=A0A8D8VGU2_9HEMI
MLNVLSLFNATLSYHKHFFSSSSLLILHVRSIVIWFFPLSYFSSSPFLNYHFHKIFSLSFFRTLISTLKIVAWVMSRREFYPLSVSPLTLSLSLLLYEGDCLVQSPQHLLTANGFGVWFGVQGPSLSFPLSLSLPLYLPFSLSNKNDQIFPH